MTENKFKGLMPYEALRNAIVEQAADDYRKAVKTIRNAEKKLLSLEDSHNELSLVVITDPESGEAKEHERKLYMISRKIEGQKLIIANGIKAIKDVEKFFRSDWYKAICSVDGNRMISQLREEVDSSE